MSITLDGELNSLSVGNSPLTLNGQGLVIPKGNTLQRPSFPVSGTVRFNTETQLLEGYDGTSWIRVGAKL